MGGSWGGQPTGTFGCTGCFSLQSYKHVNGGEGGLIATDDEDVAARAILYSGSYMLYGQHRIRPDEEVFARWRDITPNFSLRMSNLVAAASRPQLALLSERSRVWNSRYERLAELLAELPGVRLPQRPHEEQFVPSSIQFAVVGVADAPFAGFLDRCRARGVYLKWFGAAHATGYTSVSSQWGFLRDPHTPAATAGLLERLCDMRIPLMLSDDECVTTVTILSEELAVARGSVCGST
jgi:hypothetical protein